MAGRGAPPKDPSQRARRNKDLVPTTVVEIARVAPQVDLPDYLLPEGHCGWHSGTLRWWHVMSSSPLVAALPEVDWQELHIMARCHQLWMVTNDLKWVTELRLRAAQFGTTPDSRARLRIQLADADEKDARRRDVPAGESARDRYADLVAAKGSHGPGGSHPGCGRAAAAPAKKAARARAARAS